MGLKNQRYYYFNRKKTMIRNLFFTLATVITTVSFGQVDNEDILLKKAKKLVSKLSTEEKIAQTCQITLDALLKTDKNGIVILPIQIDENKLNTLIEKQSVYTGRIYCGPT